MTDTASALIWCFFIITTYLIKNTRKSRGMATIAAPACFRQSFSVQRFQTVSASIAALIVKYTSFTDGLLASIDSCNLL